MIQIVRDRSGAIEKAFIWLRTNGAKCALSLSEVLVPTASCREGRGLRIYPKPGWHVPLNSPFDSLQEAWSQALTKLGGNVPTFAVVHLSHIPENVQQRESILRKVYEGIQDGRDSALPVVGKLFSHMTSLILDMGDSSALAG
jgi:hypothetical protein